MRAVLRRQQRVLQQGTESTPSNNSPYPYRSPQRSQTHDRSKRISAPVSTKALPSSSIIEGVSTRRLGRDLELCILLTAAESPRSNETVCNRPRPTTTRLPEASHWYSRACALHYPVVGMSKINPSRYPPAWQRWVSDDPPIKVA
jgi:hypothetical protein